MKTNPLAVEPEVAAIQPAVQADVWFAAAKALADNNNLHSVLETLLLNLNKLVPFDSACVARVEEKSFLRIYSSRGQEYGTSEIGPTAKPVIDLRESPILLSALNKSLRVANTADQANWLYFSDMAHVRNWIGAPLIVEGQAIGLLCLEKTTADFFTNEHLELAEMMAIPVSAAIQNATLRTLSKKAKTQEAEDSQSLVQQNQRQATLAELKIALHEPAELETVLRQVVQVVTWLLPATDSSVILWDEEADIFHTSASTVEKQPPQTPARRVRRRAGATRWIVDNKQSLVVPDIKNDKFGANNMLLEYGYQAYAGVPLMTGSTCIGVLYALDREIREYQQNDIDYLQALANHSAAAIDNVRLFQELKKKEAQLNTFISNAPVLLFALDSAGNLTFAKGTALKLLGFDVEAAIGKPFAELLSEFPQIIEDALRTLSGEHVQTTAELLEHTWDIKYSPILDEYSKVSSMIGVATDVTALKAAEKEQAILHAQTRKILARTEALYTVSKSLVAVSDLATLLQTIVDKVTEVLPANRSAIYILDQDSRKVEQFVIGGAGAANDEAASYEDLVEGLTGWALRESKPVLSSKAQLDPRESPRIQQRRIRDEAGSIIVVPLRYHDTMIGTLTTIRRPEEPDFVEEDVTLLAAIANQVAAAIQTATLHREVQYHVKALESRVAERTAALTEANTRLLQMGRLRTKYMHDVSHELRTPLTTLKLYLKLLSSGGHENQDRYLGVLQETSARLEELVEGVLHLSRLPIDSGELKLAKVEFNQLLQELLTPFAAALESKNIALEFSPLEGGAFVWGDADQLRLAIKSLLKNALTFTVEGKITVQISSEPINKRTLLIVSDTGSGIAEEDRSHIFEPFYRGNPVSQSTTPGMGIGLTILKEIVAMHQGEITFETELDVGTTFIVSLPSSPTQT